TLCSETSETLTIIIAQVKTIVEVLSITHSIVLVTKNNSLLRRFLNLGLDLVFLLWLLIRAYSVSLCSNERQDDGELKHRPVKYDGLRWLVRARSLSISWGREKIYILI
ncbi:hypothetical protein HID58_054786, partial [Brassica napus]